jgi:hypothetical protein
MLKVLVVARNPNFLAPILRELNRRGCEVQQFVFSDDETFDLVQLHELMMRWADCAFFDWVYAPLPETSRFPTRCRISARMHRIEVYDKAKLVDWSRVHLICTKTQYMRFQKQIGLTPLSYTEANVGCNTAPAATPKKTFNHTLGLITYTPLPRKRIYTTIESFFDLLSRSESKDVDWTLHIRGAELTGFNDNVTAEYLKFIGEFSDTLKKMGLPVNRVVFHGFLKQEEYAKFLSSLDIIISNSMQEGYHQSVFEAMAYGASPLVHHWFGAETLFPEKCLFLTQRDLVRKIIQWEQQSMMEKQDLSLQVQKFVQEQHNEDCWAQKIVDAILGEKQS